MGNMKCRGSIRNVSRCHRHALKSGGDSKAAAARQHQLYVDMHTSTHSHTHIHAQKEIESHMLGVRVLFAGTLFIYLLINALPLRSKREKEGKGDRKRRGEPDREWQRQWTKAHRARELKKERERDRRYWVSLGNLLKVALAHYSYAA